MGSAQLVEHAVEGCAISSARGIGRQGCRVRGTGLGPDPLDDPRVVEVLAHQARDLLDERRSRGTGLDHLDRCAKVQTQRAEHNDRRQDDGRGQASATMHGCTGSWPIACLSLAAHSLSICATFRMFRPRRATDQPPPIGGCHDQPGGDAAGVAAVLLLYIIPTVTAVGSRPSTRSRSSCSICCSAGLCSSGSSRWSGRARQSSGDRGRERQGISSGRPRPGSG